MTVYQEIMVTAFLMASAGITLAGLVRWRRPDYGIHGAILIISLTAYFVWTGLIPRANATWLWGVFFTAGVFSASLTIITTKNLTEKLKIHRRGRKRTREDLIWWFQIAIMLLELTFFYEVFPRLMGPGGWLTDYHIALSIW